jgi:hypothetical protein
MDKESAFESCLTQYSPIRGRDLKDKLGERGVRLSDAQFFRYARKMEKAGKLERHDGIYTYSAKKTAEVQVKEEPPQAEAFSQAMQGLAGYNPIPWEDIARRAETAAARKQTSKI